MIIDERERGIERFTLGEITEATSHDFWNQDGAHVRFSAHAFLY